VRLYAFEGEDPDLKLLPLAARRALDHVGQKLSLAAWQKLPLGTRQELVRLGSPEVTDPASIVGLLLHAEPEPSVTPKLSDPLADQIPSVLSLALGAERPLPLSSWAALMAVDRYALWKVASRGGGERLDKAYAELIGDSALSSHLQPHGGVRMVNVTRKPKSERVAVAESFVSLNAAAIERLLARDVPKGDVFATARVAGIMAAKKTSDWIPLCHPLNLTRVAIELELDRERGALRILAETEVYDRTGVEMEALVAASAAALTVYDMLKSFDRGMQIGPTRLVSKSGGRSNFQRVEAPEAANTAGEPS
jgi:cyclic pyranopterin phosphate synthase